MGSRLHWPIRICWSLTTPVKPGSNLRIWVLGHENEFHHQTNQERHTTTFPRSLKIRTHNAEIIIEKIIQHCHKTLKRSHLS